MGKSQDRPAKEAILQAATKRDFVPQRGVNVYDLVLIRLNVQVIGKQVFSLPERFDKIRALSRTYPSSEFLDVNPNPVFGWSLDTGELSGGGTRRPCVGVVKPASVETLVVAECIEEGSPLGSVLELPLDKGRGHMGFSTIFESTPNSGDVLLLVLEEDRDGGGEPLRVLGVPGLGAYAASHRHEGWIPSPHKPKAHPGGLSRGYPQHMLEVTILEEESHFCPEEIMDQEDRLHALNRVASCVLCGASSILIDQSLPR